MRKLSSSINRQGNASYKILAIVLMVGILTVLTYYAQGVIKIGVIYSHLFYLPIILACVWWRLKGMIVPIVLGFMLLVLHELYNNWGFFPEDVLRSLMFIIVGGVVTLMSEELELVYKELAKHSKNLENIVAERTKSLSKSNEELEMEILKKEAAEAKLKNLNETLTVLNKILRHDIANNLTVASLSLEMLEAEDKYLKERAQRAMFKCMHLIEEIGTLETAIDSEMESKHCNLKSVVDSVIKNYPETKFKVSGDCNVYADDAIFSVFDNIVSNSIFHGKSDSIDISIKEIADHCEVKISDNGTGIPDEIKDKIFEEGVSFGENKGSGLGLYIVKKVIERYGGDITIEDSELKGAAFMIKLKKS